MTVKEWLENARKLDVEIKQLQIEKEKAYNLACGSSGYTSNERVQTSKQNSIECKFTAYVEYSRQLDEKILELISYQKNVQAAINKIDNTIYRTLLRCRYIECISWEKIAEKIDYRSEKWVRTSLHNKAIKELEEVIKPLPDTL